MAVLALHPHVANLNAMMLFQRRRNVVTSPPAHLAAQITIDRFVFLLGFVHLQGRIIHAPSLVKSVRFSAGTTSHDTSLRRDHFDLRIDLGDGFEMVKPSLLLTYSDGRQAVFENIGQEECHAGLGHRLFPIFLHKVAAMSSGNFLEIGSRARSGISRRQHIPASWEYTGFDIKAGENVDVVGDAHELSTMLPHNHYHAVMALSVFEHLLMPWKVALEMNKVMAPGGFAFIFTHQSFPLHDEPWDYLRFSQTSWQAFFNEKTGFRILEAGVAEPVYLVGQRWNPGVNHRLLPGMTVSSVLIEKISDTTLTWDVSSIVDTQYPV
jgi:hypothetical protein